MIPLFLLGGFHIGIFAVRICSRIIGSRLIKHCCISVIMTVLPFVGLIRKSGNTHHY